MDLFARGEGLHRILIDLALLHRKYVVALILFHEIRKNKLQKNGITTKIHDILTADANRSFHHERNLIVPVSDSEAYT